MRLRKATCAAAGLLLALTAGCTGGGDDDSDRASPSAGARTGTPSASPSPTRTPVNPVSIPGLIQRKHTGSDLRLGTVLARTAEYTRYEVTYKANGLTISGVMNIPDGKGPFPALVLAHGYIPPERYVTGQGMPREHDRLARDGYVVLHTDYRNHASSDKDPDNDVDLRLGYTEDVIGAVHALRSSGRPEIDGDRIGLLGRSMGGGVVHNALVVAPGLVDAAAVYAPVSSRAADNFQHFQRREGDAVADDIEAAHGSPEENPEFWRKASPLTYVDRVTEPLLIHHGTADDTCPIAWTRRTVAGFEAAGKDVQLRTYKGEGHTFGPQWPESMDATTAFFERHLG